jgi:hypothetical protein
VGQSDLKEFNMKINKTLHGWEIIPLCKDDEKKLEEFIASIDVAKGGSPATHSPSCLPNMKEASKV